MHNMRSMLRPPDRLSETEHVRFSPVMTSVQRYRQGGCRLTVKLPKLNSINSPITTPAVEAGRPNRWQNLHHLSATDTLLLGDGTSASLGVDQDHVVAVMHLVGGPTHLCCWMQSPLGAEMPNAEQD